MKYLPIFVFALVCCYLPTTTSAQSLTANNDTAFLYTEYQPILISPLLNDVLSIALDYSIDVRIIDEPQQGLAAFISDDILGNEWTLLYLPYGDFGVSDSFTYQIFSYDEFGIAVDSSNIATITVVRNELPSDDCLSDCVYPGDTNRDGIVNADDLLYIGIGYGFSGVPRPETELGIDWQPHAANDWAADLGGLNFKHFDCNGDGTIDDTDMEAIIMNYGMSHLSDFSATAALPIDTSPINVSLSILNSSPMQIGDTITADIVLGNAIELISVYGLSFSMMYNAEDGGTGHIEFLPSFIGTDTNTVNMQKNQGGGRIDAALSRISHTQAQGSGSIARVSFVMENFLEGKQLSDLLTLTIDRFSLLGGDGSVVNMNIAEGNATASIEVILSTDPPSPINRVFLSPNPTDTYLQVSWQNKESLQNVALYDTKGKIVYRQTVNSNTVELPISTAQLPEGIYIVVLQSAIGITAKRVVVSH